MGYLEQTVASAVSKSLLALVRARPKLPRISVKKSALYFLALHLKAHNPASSKYLLSHADSQLQQYTEFSRLIPLLSKHISAATTHPPPSPSDLSLPSPHMLEKLLQVENSFPTDVKSFDEFLKFDLETLIQLPNSTKSAQ